MSLGDTAGFDSDRDRLERLSAEVPDWHRHAFLRLWRGARAMMEGRFDDTETELGGLLDLGIRSHDPNVQNLALGQLIFLRRAQGRLGELAAVVEQQCRRQPLVTAFACGATLMHAESGEPDQAARSLGCFVDGGSVRVPRDLTWTTSLCFLTEAAIAVSDARFARTLLDALSPYRGQVAVLSKGMAVTGAFDRYIGGLQALLGDEGARASFEAALELESSLNAPALVARTMVRFGGWLICQTGRKDQSLGESLLGEARGLASAFRMRGLLSEISAQPPVVGTVS